jgi:hypothetical protein
MELQKAASSGMPSTIVSAGAFVGPIEAGLWSLEGNQKAGNSLEERTGSFRHGPTAAAAAYSSRKVTDSHSTGRLSGTAHYTEDFEDSGSTSSSQQVRKRSVIPEEMGGDDACETALRSSASCSLDSGCRSGAIEEELPGCSGSGSRGYVAIYDSIESEAGMGYIAEEVGARHPNQVAAGAQQLLALDLAMEIEEDAQNSVAEAIEGERSMGGSIAEELPAELSTASTSSSKQGGTSASWLPSAKASSRSQSQTQGHRRSYGSELEDEEEAVMGNHGEENALGISSSAANNLPWNPPIAGSKSELSFRGVAMQGVMAQHAGEGEAVAGASGTTGWGVKGVDDAERLLFSNLSSSLQRLVSGGEDALGLRSMLEQEVSLRLCRSLLSHLVTLSRVL